MNRLKAAIRLTLPVLFGYIPLGMGFGFLLRDLGYPVPLAAAMSVTMYAGSGQYLAVELFRSGATLVTMFLASFFVNIRHTVYGLSLLEKFEHAGRLKPYCIFALTDEAYALFVSSDLEHGESGGSYPLISLLCHLYWIGGCVLGAALGGVLRFDTTGMGFVLTALFIVLALDMRRASPAPAPYAIGAAAALIALFLAGGDWMMPVALLITLAALIALREPIERSMACAEVTK